MQTVSRLWLWQPTAGKWTWALCARLACVCWMQSTGSTINTKLRGLDHRLAACAARKSTPFAYLTPCWPATQALQQASESGASASARSAGSTLPEDDVIDPEWASELHRPAPQRLQDDEVRLYINWTLPSRVAMKEVNRFLLQLKWLPASHGKEILRAASTIAVDPLKSVGDLGGAKLPHHTSVPGLAVSPEQMEQWISSLLGQLQLNTSSADNKSSHSLLACVLREFPLMFDWQSERNPSCRWVPCGLVAGPCPANLWFAHQEHEPR